MQTKFPVLRRRVVYSRSAVLYRLAPNGFPSRKRWVELKLLRAGRRRKGPIRSDFDEKENITLIDRGRDCRRGIWRGLPPVLRTLEHDSRDLVYD